LLILFVVLPFIVTAPAPAQTRAGALTIRICNGCADHCSGAGILILMRPRLLNYVMAIYLILIGLIGILGG
jgi:hypothetical protein